MAQQVFERLRTMYGDRSVLMMACRELTRMRECQLFYKQYVSYLATKGDVLDPEETGRQAMIRAINQFSSKVLKRWQKAIPELFE